MSDLTLNRIIQYGTQAERLAFEPDPAIGSQVLYLWLETDNLPDVYAWDGSQSPPDWELINGGRLIGKRVITTTGAGTYTPTTGTKSVVIELQGAGGGGGGVPQPGSGNNAFARGGGGGGYIRTRLTSAFSGAGYSVGAKGTGGTAGNNAGTAGGNTTFQATGGGTLYTAGGGSGGNGGAAFTATNLTASAAATAGGTTTNGDIQRPGEPSGHCFNLASAQLHSGEGGDSPYGSRGAWQSAGTNASNAGNAATGKGAGGGGACASGTGAAQAGGDGSDGILIIWEYS